MNKAIVRIIQKYSKEAGVVPTIPISNDHLDGTWISTDLYEGELFLNTADQILYTRVASTIVIIGSGAMGALGDLSDVDTTGVGDLYQLYYDDATSTWLVSSPLWVSGAGTGSVLQNNGTSNVASGTYAIAMGNGSEATADNSVAIGETNNVSGVNSTAIGKSNYIEGSGCIVLGTNNTALGGNSIIKGSGVYGEIPYAEMYSCAPFATGYYSQKGSLIMKIKTSSMTSTNLESPVNDAIQIRANHSYLFHIKPLVRERFTGDTATVPDGVITFIVKDIGGTTSGGFSAVAFTLGDASLSDCEIYGNVSSNSLQLIVIGQTAAQLYWDVSIEWLEIGAPPA